MLSLHRKREEKGKGKKTKCETKWKFIFMFGKLFTTNTFCELERGLVYVLSNYFTGINAFE